jgi:hypothetical protein
MQTSNGDGFLPVELVVRLLERVKADPTVERSHLRVFKEVSRQWRDACRLVIRKLVLQREDGRPLVVDESLVVRYVAVHANLVELVMSGNIVSNWLSCSIENSFLIVDDTVQQIARAKHWEKLEWSATVHRRAVDLLGFLLANHFVHCENLRELRFSCSGGFQDLDTFACFQAPHLQSLEVGAGAILSKYRSSSLQHLTVIDGGRIRSPSTKGFPNLKSLDLTVSAFGIDNSVRGELQELLEGSPNLTEITIRTGESTMQNSDSCRGVLLKLAMYGHNLERIVIRAIGDWNPMQIDDHLGSLQESVTTSCRKLKRIKFYLADGLEATRDT